MHRSRAALVLALSLAGISFAAPLVRLSDAHPLAVAAWRLGFSLLIVGGFLAATGSWRQWRLLSGRDLLLGAAAGVMLALHFWSWNASLGYTTVAASVVLVNLQPAFVGVISALALREPPGRAGVAGIVLAMAGALVVALPDLRGDAGAASDPILGDALAVVGAVTAAGYYSVGRSLRQKVDLWPYVGLVYGACFVALVLMAVAVDAPLVPQPPRELAIFAALALGPMMLGHTGMNWALRHLPAYVVNLTVLGEPVGATLLAWLLPGIRETPGFHTLAGGALILAGVLVASRRR